MRLSTGTVVPMSELRVGDSVLSVDVAGNQVYSEVLLFLDRDPGQVRTFIHLKTESGRTLTLTPSHLLETSSTDSSEFRVTFAGKLEPGNIVLVNTEDSFLAEKVVEVSVTKLKGVYAPLTVTGTLVVDDVLASSYAVIDSQTIAHAAFAPIRWLHSFKSNVRYVWRTVTFSSSEGRSMPYIPADGVHWYASMLYGLASYVLPDHLVMNLS